MEKTPSTPTPDGRLRGRQPSDEGPGRGVISRKAKVTKKRAATLPKRSPNVVKGGGQETAAQVLPTTLPAALLRCARREKVDPAALAVWLLEVMDDSTLRESARIFKNLH